MHSNTNPEAGQKLARALPVFLYGFAAIFLLVALGLVALGRNAVADARLLAADGVPVAATVSNRRVTETRSRDTDERWRTSTSYRVTLTFTAASGEAVTVDRAVDRVRFESLAEGQVVEIFHLPARPTLVGFEKGDGGAGMGFLGLMAGIFGVVGLGIGWLGVWLRRRLAAAS